MTVARSIVAAPFLILSIALAAQPAVPADPAPSGGFRSPNAPAVPGGCEATGWNGVHPPTRSGSSAAYDSGRGVTVVLTGTGDDVEVAETWEWDGASWTLRATGQPELRSSTAMAYDSARARTVLFGGLRLGFNEQDDTWEWDGTSWTRVANGGPSPRFGHAMAYDPVRGGVLLFGGRSCIGGCAHHADLWLWDGTSWTELAGAGPPVRWGAGLAFDTGRGEAVLYGGRADIGYSTARDDTWVWDGTSWTEVQVPGPPARSQIAATYDAARGVTVVSGGHDVSGDLLDDTWEFDGVGWSAVATATSPPARARHDLAYDAARGEVVLFGGEDAADIWEFDGSRWVERASDPPSLRARHAMAYDSARGEVILFGGWKSMYFGDDLVHGDTWVWDGERWWERAASGPSPRYGHAMAYSPNRAVTVMFGGQTGSRHLQETWEWDGSSWAPITLDGPSPRSGHGMVHDGARDVALLFGGTDESGTYFGDTWQWDATSWSEIVVAGPSPRTSRLAFDPRRGVVVLFGGYDGQTSFADTWEWDGTSWSEMTVSGPSARRSHTLTYDPRLEAVVLYGGRSTFLPSRDVWTWDGSSWTEITDAVTAGNRADHAAAYDAARDGILVFGGTNVSGNFDPEYDDTWMFRAAQIRLEQSALVQGAPALWRVSGAEPQEIASVLRSFSGEGPGPCLPQIGGKCLDILAPIALLGQASADAGCRAELTIDVPPAAPLGPVSAQAGVIRGAGGTDSLTSNAVTAPLLAEAPPVSVRLSHRASPGETWSWCYDLRSSDPETTSVVLSAFHEHPDGAVPPADEPATLELDPFASLFATSELTFAPGAQLGDHRVRVEIADPVSGAVLDSGSSRVRLGRDVPAEALASAPRSRAAGAGTGARGAAVDLSVCVPVDAGTEWRYVYEVTNPLGEPVDVSVEVELTDPTGAATIVEGPVPVGLAAVTTLELTGVHALDAGAVPGSYTAVARLLDATGLPSFESAPLTFRVLGP